MGKMAMLRAVLFCSLAVAGVACGDDDDDKETGSSNGGSGNGGNGNGGNGASAGERDENGNCVPAESECTQAEQDAYSSCVTTKCDSQYKTCFGADYKSGTFSGPCGEYITCTSKCGCDDTACFQACAPSSECTNCLTPISSCVQQCEIPDCYTGGGSGGLPEGGLPGSGMTCADLKACCDGMSAGSSKDQCAQTYMAVMAGGDAACGAAASVFQCK